MRRRSCKEGKGVGATLLAAVAFNRNPPLIIPALITGNNMTQLFDTNKFYVIRAERAGVFFGKILSVEGDTLQVSNLRRLYKWSGALDVIQIAADGVDGSSCKFSVQMGDNDKSAIMNVIEFHPASEKSIQSINNVQAWKR
jgi:hypothetical protein